ncbi:unnamed protein product [Brassicogethes aeneus]|uniref:Transmembrane protein 183 n=1 Tax=Brassicogethes aeneus TaxID=1431903 RepID=A0A9P0FKB5_BRAAE|nr:unnamed protein product [Brassicogethes aeneus]
MPNKKSAKKSKNLGDITLNDFANSLICKNRPKKTNPSLVLNNFKDEKSWDEKIDEFDGDFVKEENEDGTVSYVIKETRHRKKTISQTNEINCVNGNVYPIDIWFILSEYIRPEDVGCFAGICKSTYNVVSTAKFWYNLYKRFYINVPNLPELLQPECLVRKYSLRTSVIRSLHYMYIPFINRMKNISDSHPDKVTKRECILMWHEKKKQNWFYYFKMKEKPLLSLHSRRTSEMYQPDLLEILDDIYANQDENCQILQITCKHFIPVQPVLGLTLTSVHFSLSSGFLHYKLQLGFSSGIQSYTKTTDGSTDVTVILDPVINVKVLDWWHPLYPYSHNLQHLMNQD